MQFIILICFLNFLEIVQKLKITFFFKIEMSDKKQNLLKKMYLLSLKDPDFIYNSKKNKIKINSFFITWLKSNIFSGFGF
jgi:hypothetical protein